MEEDWTLEKAVCRDMVMHLHRKEKTSNFLSTGRGARKSSVYVCACVCVCGPA